MAQFPGRQRAHSDDLAWDAVAMRVINHAPRNRLGLDTEEDLEGFIQFLDRLSILSYTPVMTVMAGVLVGVVLRRVRPKVAGGIFVILAALNWTLVWWLGHHFLRPPDQRAPHTPGDDRTWRALVR